MPTQKHSISVKHSFDLISNMEPENVLPRGMYSRCEKSANSRNGNPLIEEMCSAQNSEFDKPEESPRMTTSQWLTVLILCFVNLINYMDRYTIAGILTDVKKYYVINDDKAGLLQTAFVISYMLFAPIFGYLGDRYNRKNIMAFGVFLWSLTTMAGSFMETYYPFLFFRMLVGIGEASYSTVAPTIISDMFAKNLRSKMLAAFYFAIPVGSGFGYIVGSKTAEILNCWQWGLRVTPFAGIVAVLLILFVMEEPTRGFSEGRSHLQATSWTSDIKILMHNRSFMLSTAGFTCVAFVTGALAWWGPTFIHAGLRLQSGHAEADLNTVSYVFGILTMISGLIGVPLGMWLSQRMKSQYEHADPLICAFGLLVSAPLLFLASWTASYSVIICYIFVFIGEVFLNLNWSIVADILLYVVEPTRRSTAEAFQILVSHAFGDAGSPYLIGVLSEFFKAFLKNGAVLAVFASTDITIEPSHVDGLSPQIEFRSLQYALFTTSFVEVLGGVFFLLTAMYVVEDKQAAERQLQGVRDFSSLNLSYELMVKNGMEKSAVVGLDLFGRRGILMSSNIASEAKTIQ
ncbi:protein spinster isoform X1 [Planococcus citri]|uniref:protein spinster isoform X1 n=1 Tax=Planococcus citri TaxID=170843 RepID=UPI0031FA2260